MLSIGDTLYLDFKQPNELLKFKCKVEYVGEEVIHVTYPTNIHTDKTEFLMVGSLFEAQFITKEKATFVFPSELVDRKKDRIPLLVLKYPKAEQHEKIQRRAFVRVETSVDVSVHSLDHQFSPFKTFTSDISAGGCAIVLPEKHSIMDDMIIECWIVLPLKNKYQYIRQNAKVIRVLKGNPRERDKAPLEFLDVNETDRQSILRFCFEEQLLLKKKGLL
ncbi:flagellar brake protein [Alkalihalobacillus sp. AL-G]|uniref:flagellar brake protein n=1 Tax=Alkalihalobacillus sp. AL-G TaxID=2926399 RepID=UPI00272D7AF1|nr:PilZ domain-containing protein [Alkalihalobacillus sp. AL-G]WLD91847.1 PilZ domain-containing protein [Alkalihalobacillus sp. AL-G]